MSRGTLRTVSAILLFLGTDSIGISQVQLENAFPALRFRAPIDLQHPGDGTNRLFVVEQRGVLNVFENTPSVSSSQVFLDISDRVLSGGELGLLGLAFHPDFATNGYFYVNYTASNPRRTIVARFQAVPANADASDAATELILLEVPQPYSNHNAGQLVFGNDGYLYVALGDGGSGGDPGNNGQDRRTLLGSILRIDVDGTTDSTQYRIPADNPFVGNLFGYREEIYAYGLRNPWRFSVDRPTGRIWAGDVGQGAREEIDLIERGGNYGWRIMEGTLCYDPSIGCSTSGLTMPVFDYGRAEGNSVTGGYVYRGPGMPELTGKYVYGDFGSGRVWALTIDGVPAPVNQLLIDTPLAIASFGTDAAGELYVVEYKDPGAAVYRFSPATSIRVAEPATVPHVSRLLQNYPNPFNPTTDIPFLLAQGGDVRIEVYDIQGRLKESLPGGVLPPGRHTIRWSIGESQGAPPPSGTYYYRLVLNRSVIDTRPMVVLR